MQQPGRSLSSGSPITGQLWHTSGSHDYGVYLQAGIWNVLQIKDGEYGLTQITSISPLALGLHQPADNSFAGHFDALAASAGLGITWQSEIDRYRREGLAKVVNR